MTLHNCSDFMKHFGVSFVTGGEAIPAPDASLMVDDKGSLNEISPKEKTDKVTPMLCLLPLCQPNVPLLACCCCCDRIKNSVSHPLNFAIMP